MNIAKQIDIDKSFVNNILITIVIGVLVNFLNYLFTVFLARNLGTQDFGLYNAALGIISIVQIPAIAIQTAVTKKVASKKNFNLNKFKYKSTLQLALFAILISVIFLIFGNSVSDIANIPSKYILPLSFVVFGSIVSPVAKGFLLGLEKILSFNLISLIETVLKFALGFLAIYSEAGMIPIILAFALPSVVTFIFILPLVRTKSQETPKENISLNYKHIFYIFLTFLFLNIPFTLDLVLVNPEVRASYGALSLLGKIVYFGSVTIASLMISKLANSHKQLRKKTLLISLFVSGLTGLAITFVYFLFTKEIVQIVFDGMYLEIVKYLVPYAIAMIASSISYMVINSLLVEDSYIHLIFFFLLTILQILLYTFNNETLHDAFINQVIIYSVLSVFVLFILIFFIFNKYGEKPKREN